MTKRSRLLLQETYAALWASPWRTCFRVVEIPVQRSWEIRPSSIRRHYFAVGLPWDVSMHEITGTDLRRLSAWIRETTGLGPDGLRHMIALVAQRTGDEFGVERGRRPLVHPSLIGTTEDLPHGFSPRDLDAIVTLPLDEARARYGYAATETARAGLISIAREGATG